ncbi:MAG: hypothetical protein N2Z70_04960, partial [Bdellovibrionaceae bacterium]|nr:hypothetical protein [Pseudobdellovibrionaceae bacterium]
MLPATLIKKKRNGGQLHREEIEAFFTGYLKGQVTVSYTHLRAH